MSSAPFYSATCEDVLQTHGIHKTETSTQDRSKGNFRSDDEGRTQADSYTPGLASSQLETGEWEEVLRQNDFNE